MKIAIYASESVGLEFVKFACDKYRGNIACVVTVSEDEIFELSKNKGLSVYVNRSGSEMEMRLPDFDWGILVWWPHVISSQTLGLARNGFLNIHPSYLPWARGKHTSFWTIYEGSPFGVTLHQVNERLDAGAIVFQEQIEYGWEDTGETLQHKSREKALEVLINQFPKILSGELKFTSQQPGGTFHMAKDIANKTQIYLDNSYTAREILNQIRAKQHSIYGNCYFEDSGDIYEVSVQIKRKETQSEL